MLQLPETLTVREATATLRMLEQGLRAAASQARLVIDAAPLKYFDSSALAVLLECERQAAARGKHVEVRGLPSRLASLAELYGVAAILPAAE